MKLAIADPPYLGRAEMFYGAADVAQMNIHGAINQTFKADRHPDAAEWDNPARHQALVGLLTSNYDGWAVAMVPANLRHYFQWVPEKTRVAVWHDPRVMPTGSHPRRRWEPVMIYVPAGRRRIRDIRHHVGDVLTAPHPHGSFAGMKPAAWTRWVLSMLGYDQDLDTVEDLFPGSGAVSAEVAQLVIDL